MVLAAEAKFGRKNGMEKLDQVLSWMAEKNLHVNEVAIKEAVLAVWKGLDLKMLELGLKLPPQEPSEN